MAVPLSRPRSPSSASKPADPYDARALATHPGAQRPPPAPFSPTGTGIANLLSPKHQGLTLSQLHKQVVQPSQVLSGTRRSSVGRRNSLDYAVDCGSLWFKHLSLTKAW